MRYLDVPYFKQDTGYTCGPTSLQMVLAYYGIIESEETLTKEMRPNPRDGTPHHHMIESALKRGLHCYVNEDATLAEMSYLLACKVPAIVHFIEPSQPDDHYSVVVGISDKEIVLNDPWNGEGVRFSCNDFLRRWACGTVGVCSKWLMAATREPLPLGRQYHPHE